MNRSVLITGASSGIGAATAEHLVARGFRVFGTSRDTNRRGEEGAVHWIPMDVCEDSSVSDGVADVMKETEQLDGVVCCAGFGIYGSVEEVSMAEARAQMETNFFGVLRVLKATLPHIRAARSGRIVLVGSLSGRAAIPFQAHYSASKAALDALAMSLHNEVRALGVRVSLVEPGDIATPFNDAMTWTKCSPESPYAGSLARCEETIRVSLPKAPPPKVVAKAIARALESRWPRARYAVGADSKLVPFGKRLLPDLLGLRIIRSHFRL